MNCAVIVVAKLMKIKSEISCYSNFLRNSKVNIRLPRNIVVIRHFNNIVSILRAYSLTSSLLNAIDTVCI